MGAGEAGRGDTLDGREEGERAWKLGGQEENRLSDESAKGARGGQDGALRRSGYKRVKFGGSRLSPGRAAGRGISWEAGVGWGGGAF